MQKEERIEVYFSHSTDKKINAQTQKKNKTEKYLFILQSMVRYNF